MRRLLCGLCCCALITATYAQNYPAKPVRLIVPWPAGGTTDILGRVIGQKLNEAWGQPVVIENRGGAAGNIGTEVVVKAPADGYTLLFGNMGTHATNQFMYSGMTFDPVTDLAPISLIANVGTVLVVHPNLPVKNVKELVALAKKRPGQLDFASGGVGSFNQLCAELLKMETGINIVHVPYRGAAPAVNDLLAQQVQMVFLDLPVLLPQIKAGKLKPIAVGAMGRVASLPEVPTTVEVGMGHLQTENWYGMVAPAKTPPQVVAVLNKAAVEAMKDPTVIEKLASQGTNLVGDTPEHFRDYIDSETKKWAKVIADAGVQTEKDK